MKNLVLLVVLCCTTVACNKANFETVLVTPHYSYFYSADFARRFSLPEGKAVKLGDEHLKAIAIGIRKIDRNYVCNIHLYFDDTIKLYSPQQGNIYYQPAQPESAFVKHYNDLDYQYYDQQLANNSGRAYFRSSSLKINKTGTSSTLGYSAYKHDFLPGLNLASFEIGCGFLDAAYGRAELWVQKSGIKNYKLINEDPLNIQHRENNYHFDIPLALLQSVKPLIDRIKALPVDRSASNVSMQYGVKE